LSFRVRELRANRHQISSLRLPQGAGGRNATPPPKHESPDRDRANRAIHRRQDRECDPQVASGIGGHNGTKVTEGGQIVAAGILSPEGKNTWGIVYTTMNRADEFEKAGPGAFRLTSRIQAQEQSLLQ